jgi:hypothetical protein
LKEKEKEKKEKKIAFRLILMTTEQQWAQANRIQVLFQITGECFFRVWVRK